ncbi:MAG: hypothetical protein RLZZ292_650 [Bacteroidota bacterium]|jgi:hypothetical protein
MARTIQEIQAEMITAIQGNLTLSALNSTSVVAIWRLITYTVAVAIATFENIQDGFRVDLLDMVARQKPHTLRWYQAKALAFQLGSVLPSGEDEYDNTLLTPAQVAAQKIIAHAATIEDNAVLLVKVAKQLGGELFKLSVIEYDAFSEYLFLIKDAGVNTLVISQDGDKLKLNMDIYYDPLVLTPTGGRIDGTDAEPVARTIKNYLKTLPFNGVFIKSRFVDALQVVEGVVVPEVRLCQATRFDSTNFISVDIQYKPYSGWLRFEDVNIDLNLTYIAYDV